jgi:hypothetical protein
MVKRKYSLHYIVVGERKDYKSFVKHLYDTNPKVCNMFHHIYINVKFFPFFLVLINVQNKNAITIIYIN